MKQLIAILLLMMLALDIHAESDAAQNYFKQGVDAYHTGDFAKSAAYFTKAAQISASAGAFHNLGDAEWQLGRSGPAILAWERAQWLAPFNPNPRGNLRFARKARLLDNPELAWCEICSTWLPVNVWPWLACVSFWGAISLVILPGVFGWRASWLQALAAAGFAIFLLTLPAMYGVHTRAKMGIILPRDAFLRLTPTAEGQTITRLNPGEIARLERQRGHYFFIRTATSAGWVDREQFGLIAAIP